jgi:hypothetical protein
MSGGKGRYCAALGGPGLATPAWAQESPRGPEHHDGAAATAADGSEGALAAGASVYETKSLALTREANNIAARSAEAAIRQANYGLDQVVLGGFATFFTALAAIAAIAAAYYAKHAAEAARLSAKSDHDALEETRKAGVEARREAVEQAKRVTEQLRLADQTMQFTAKSAYAMETSARATRSNANSAQRAVEVAADTASKQLRPYVYLTSEVVKTTRYIDGSVDDRAPIDFTVRNFGQTPAKKVSIRARAFVGGYWNDNFQADLSESTVIHRADMPPGFWREIDGFAVLGLSDLWPSVLLSERTIFLEGAVDYEDGAGVKYTTTFRRACTGENLYSGVFFITEGGNEAT